MAIYHTRCYGTYLISLVEFNHRLLFPLLSTVVCKHRLTSSDLHKLFITCRIGKKIYNVYLLLLNQPSNQVQVCEGNSYHL